MSTDNEQYRLEHFTRGEKPPGAYDALSFECDDVDECLARIAVVMQQLVRRHPESWPSDEHWRAVLPDWLLASFRVYSQEEMEEIRADRSKWVDLAWDFGSWLDAMRDREWRWWSSEKDGRRATIFFTVEGDPYTAEALEHLITSAGGRILT